MIANYSKKDWFDIVLLTILSPFLLLIVLPFVMIKEKINELNTPKKSPCRRHYFSTKDFEDCKECGWSGSFNPT